MTCKYCARTWNVGKAMRVRAYRLLGWGPMRIGLHYVHMALRWVWLRLPHPLTKLRQNRLRRELLRR